MKKTIACILFLLGLTIGILAKFNILINIDRYVYNLLMQIKSTSITSIFKSLTTLGNTKFIIIINIAIIIYSIIYKNKKYLIIPVSSIISFITNDILKFIFKRPRPDIAYRLISETNYSFPSGHAMISVLFYLTLIKTVNKSNIKYKGIITSFFMLIILLIGVSRIYLGVHYFSDVVGGYLIATSIVYFLDKGDRIESINNRR